MALPFSQQPGRLFIQLERDLADPKRLLIQLGVILQKQAVDAFRNQGLPGNPWKERAVPNVPGVIEDLKVGPRIKDRRWQPRPAGIDTSQTVRSLKDEAQAVRPSGLWEVMVGTRVPQATDMQYGGEKWVGITDTIRHNLAAVMRGTQIKRNRSYMTALWDKSNGVGGVPWVTARIEDARLRLLRERMGYLFRRRLVKFRVPPRPFLDVTDEALAKMQVAIQRFYRTGGGPAGVGASTPVG